jgi:hypothetical protein
MNSRGLLLPPPQGLNNAVALDFDYRQQMIYWTDVTTQSSMIRRMHINGSDVQVRRAGGGQVPAGIVQVTSPCRGRELAGSGSMVVATPLLNLGDGCMLQP